MKIVAGSLADKFHQLIGVAVVHGCAAAGRDVAAQCNNAFDAGLFIGLQKLQNLLLVGAAERQVRRDLRASGLVLHHQLTGSGFGRSPSTIGD